ncbi:MAG TPA: sodium:proton antiporter, partial [Clostridia bacterium]|nr:sodium:proton antiporter [Clostridia bacterium]
MAQKTKREATLLEALIPVLFTVGLLMYTVLPVFGVEGEVHIPLILGALVAAFVAMWRLGYTWGEIEEGVISTISGTMQAILILAIIGMIIGTWILGGIVPTLIYYGLQILSPAMFLVAACLLCCVVSL